MPTPLGNYETPDEEQFGEPTESEFVEADKELQGETGTPYAVHVGLVLLVVVVILSLIAYLFWVV